MFNKFELFGAGLSVFLMILALYMIQIKSSLFGIDINQKAEVISADKVFVDSIVTSEADRQEAYLSSVNKNGNFNRMVIDDVKFGNGEEVKKGDVVSVHYIGTLQDGTEFDNSKKRGAAFDFKVGGGQVIKGWEEGLIGMKVGGQRVLVVPPEMAYGEQGIGNVIPPNSTLVFAIELIEIK